MSRLRDTLWAVAVSAVLAVALVVAVDWQHKPVHHVAPPQPVVIVNVPAPMPAVQSHGKAARHVVRAPLPVVYCTLIPPSFPKGCV